MIVTICQGLPASGKSTWAKKQVEESKGRTKRINKDDLRAMMDKSIFSRSSEKFIDYISRTILLESLENGFDVIIDDTNLNPKVFNGYIDFLKEQQINFPDLVVVLESFNASLETCLERNSKRSNSIPEEAIRRMHEKYCPKTYIKNSKSDLGIDIAITLRSQTTFLPITKLTIKDNDVDISLDDSEIKKLSEFLSKK